MKQNAYSCQTLSCIDDIALLFTLILLFVASKSLTASEPLATVSCKGWNGTMVTFRYLIVDNPSENAPAGLLALAHFGGESMLDTGAWLKVEFRKIDCRDWLSGRVTFMTRIIRDQRPRRRQFDKARIGSVAPAGKLGELL